MALVTQPFAPTYGSKKEQAINTSAGTSQLLGNLTGTVQARLVNYETVRAAYIFGTKAACDAVTIAGNPTLIAGGLEDITVYPNPDGSPVYWNVIGDTGASNSAAKPFEVTLGVGI